VIIQLVCPNAPQCSVSAVVASCTEQNCASKTVTFPSCICPLDRVGSSCKDYRSLSCRLALEAPLTQCQNNTSDPYDSLLSGDPVCLVYDLNSTAELTYRLQCSFSPAIAIPANDSFSYYIKTPTMAISEVRNWTVRFKIFNFNVLSDLGAAVFMPLSPAQMVGNDTIMYTVSLKDLPDQYWAGNRLYFEAVFRANSSADPRGGPAAAPFDLLERRYLDAPDHVAPRGTGNNIPSGLSGGEIAGIVVGCVAA
jgi:hypothetical protein